VVKNAVCNVMVVQTGGDEIQTPDPAFGKRIRARNGRHSGMRVERSVIWHSTKY
jgi:hypothetical protein